MNKQPWSIYLKTPRTSISVKVDETLKKRMNLFLQSKNIWIEHK